jgi:lysophospholipase L1-like esterase
VGAAYSFAAVLGRAIELKLEAGRRVEVVNLGCPGWGSDRVARLYSELEVLEPDLVLVYSGHNELLRWQAREGAAAAAEGLSTALLRRSTIARWLQRWLGLGAPSVGRDSEHSLAEQIAQVTVYDPVEAPIGERRRPGEGVIAGAVRDYEKNLESIAGRARAIGVRTLFVLPVPNLMYPPAVSIHESTVDQEQHRKLELQVQEAYARRDEAEAIRIVDQAISLSPSFAMDHYWKGLIELEQGQEALARQGLQRALDLDVRTHRISSPFEEAFLGVMDTNDLEWVDLRDEFQSSAALRQPQSLFLDWVHPTRQGHQLIARALASQWARAR